MAVFTKGADAKSTGNLTDVKALSIGKEYIWKYHVPPFSFSIMSSSDITYWINQWFSLKATIQKIDPSIGDPVITVTGINVDTTSGDVFVRGKIVGLPDSNTLQAGVNPYVILSAIGVLFAAIGLAVVFMGVYEVGRAPSTNEVDPCTVSGITNMIKCWAKKGTWVGTGIGVGVLLTLLLLLFLVGRSPNA